MAEYMGAASLTEAAAMSASRLPVSSSSSSSLATSGTSLVTPTPQNWASSRTSRTASPDQYPSTPNTETDHDDTKSTNPATSYEDDSPANNNNSGPSDDNDNNNNNNGSDSDSPDVYATLSAPFFCPAFPASAVPPPPPTTTITTPTTTTTTPTTPTTKSHFIVSRPAPRLDAGFLAAVPPQHVVSGRLTGSCWKAGTLDPLQRAAGVGGGSSRRDGRYESVFREDDVDAEEGEGEANVAIMEGRAGVRPGTVVKGGGAVAADEERVVVARPKLETDSNCALVNGGTVDSKGRCGGEKVRRRGGRLNALMFGCFRG